MQPLPPKFNQKVEKLGKKIKSENSLLKSQFSKKNYSQVLIHAKNVIKAHSSLVKVSKSAASLTGLDIASIFSLVGLSYFKMDNPEKAEFAFLKSKEIKESINNIRGILESRNHPKYVIKSEETFYLSHIEISNKYIHLLTQTNFTAFISLKDMIDPFSRLFWNNLVYCYEQTNQLDKALDHWKERIQRFKVSKISDSKGDFVEFDQEPVVDLFSWGCNKLIPQFAVFLHIRNLSIKHKNHKETLESTISILNHALTFGSFKKAAVILRDFCSLVFYSFKNGVQPQIIVKIIQDTIQLFQKYQFLVPPLEHLLTYFSLNIQNESLMKISSDFTYLLVKKYFLKEQTNKNDAIDQCHRLLSPFTLDNFAPLTKSDTSFFQWNSTDLINNLQCNPMDRWFYGLEKKPTSLEFNIVFHPAQIFSCAISTLESIFLTNPIDPLSKIQLFQLENQIPVIFQLFGHLVTHCQLSLEFYPSSQHNSQNFPKNTENTHKQHSSSETPHTLASQWLFNVIYPLSSLLSYTLGQSATLLSNIHSFPQNLQNSSWKSQSPNRSSLFHPKFLRTISKQSTSIEDRSHPLSKSRSIYIMRMWYESLCFAYVAAQNPLFRAVAQEMYISSRVGFSVFCGLNNVPDQGFCKKTTWNLSSTICLPNKITQMIALFDIDHFFSEKIDHSFIFSSISSYKKSLNLFTRAFSLLYSDPKESESLLKQSILVSRKISKNLRLFDIPFRSTINYDITCQIFSDSPSHCTVALALHRTSWPLSWQVETFGALAWLNRNNSSNPSLFVQYILMTLVYNPAHILVSLYFHEFYPIYKMIFSQNPMFKALLTYCPSALSEHFAQINSLSALTLLENLKSVVFEPYDPLLKPNYPHWSLLKPPPEFSEYPSPTGSIFSTLIAWPPKDHLFQLDMLRRCQQLDPFSPHIIASLARYQQRHASPLISIKTWKFALEVLIQCLNQFGTNINLIEGGNLTFDSNTGVVPFNFSLNSFKIAYFDINFSAALQYLSIRQYDAALETFEKCLKFDSLASDNSLFYFGLSRSLYEYATKGYFQATGIVPMVIPTTFFPNDESGQYQLKTESYDNLEPFNPKIIKNHLTRALNYLFQILKSCNKSCVTEGQIFSLISHCQIALNRVADSFTLFDSPVSTQTKNGSKNAFRALYSEPWDSAHWYLSGVEELILNDLVPNDNPENEISTSCILLRSACSMEFPAIPKSYLISLGYVEYNPNLSQHCFLASKHPFGLIALGTLYSHFKVPHDHIIKLYKLLSNISAQFQGLSSTGFAIQVFHSVSSDYPIPYELALESLTAAIDLPSNQLTTLWKSHLDLFLNQFDHSFKDFPNFLSGFINFEDAKNLYYNLKQVFESIPISKFIHNSYPHMETSLWWLIRLISLTGPVEETIPFHAALLFSDFSFVRKSTSEIFHYFGKNQSLNGILDQRNLVLSLLLKFSKLWEPRTFRKIFNPLLNHLFIQYLEDYHKSLSGKSFYCLILLLLADLQPLLFLKLKVSYFDPRDISFSIFCWKTALSEFEANLFPKTLEIFQTKLSSTSFDKFSLHPLCWYIYGTVYYLHNSLSATNPKDYCMYFKHGFFGLFQQKSMCLSTLNPSDISLAFQFHCLWILQLTNSIDSVRACLPSVESHGETPITCFLRDSFSIISHHLQKYQVQLEPRGSTKGKTPTKDQLISWFFKNHVKNPDFILNDLPNWKKLVVDDNISNTPILVEVRQLWPRIIVEKFPSIPPNPTPFESFISPTDTSIQYFSLSDLNCGDSFETINPIIVESSQQIFDQPWNTSAHFDLGCVLEDLKDCSFRNIFQEKYPQVFSSSSKQTLIPMILDLFETQDYPQCIHLLSQWFRTKSSLNSSLPLTKFGERRPLNYYKMYSILAKIMLYYNFSSLSIKYLTRSIHFLQSSSNFSMKWPYGLWFYFATSLLCTNISSLPNRQKKLHKPEKIFRDHEGSWYHKFFIALLIEISGGDWLRASKWLKTGFDFSPASKKTPNPSIQGYLVNSKNRPILARRSILLNQDPENPFLSKSFYLLSVFLFIVHRILSCYCLRNQSRNPNKSATLFLHPLPSLKIHSKIIEPTEEIKSLINCLNNPKFIGPYSDSDYDSSLFDSFEDPDSTILNLVSGNIEFSFSKITAGVLPFNKKAFSKTQKKLGEISINCRHFSQKSIFETPWDSNGWNLIKKTYES